MKKMAQQPLKWPEFRLQNYNITWKWGYRGLRRWAWRNNYYAITLELPLLALLIAKLQK
jgi:hypothetical protein